MKHVVAKLGGDRALRPASADGTVEGWVAESHELAKSFAYAPEIISGVDAEGELQPINLPDEYLKAAGDRARQRVIAAGLRAGTLIVSMKVPKAPPPPQRENWLLRRPILRSACPS